MADLSSVGVVILAAGSSRRLGRPKQLLEIDGTPLVRCVVDRALSAGVHEVIVVVGNRSADVAAALAGASVRTVLNPDYATGQASSLRVGVAALSEQVDRALILLGDQPHIPFEAIAGVAVGPGPIRRAHYRGVPAHPVAFDRAIWDDLVTLDGDRGARDLLAAHPEWVQIVEIDGPVPQDVDTEDDAQALGAR